jgi:hypothetical protein
MNGLSSVLKDRAIFAGWIAGLVLVAALLWSFSFPFRSACLMRSTNKILITMDDSRRLAAPLLRPAAGPVPLGCWYRLHESSSLFLVFSIMQGGILVPCGAEISESGEVVDIIPLGSHARQVMDQIPPNLIQIYSRRIEAAASAAADTSRRGRR